MKWGRKEAVGKSEDGLLCIQERDYCVFCNKDVATLDLLVVLVWRQ